MTGAAVLLRELVGSTTLAFYRMGGDEPAVPVSMLGGRLVGPGPDGSAAQCAKTGTPVFEQELLSPVAAVFDCWYSQSAAEVDVKVEVVQHQHGCVNYASDGHWLHGWAEVDETSFEGSIHAAAQRAYADIFAVLASSATPHLLRLWNYLADITSLADGEERYRQFNAGRQQAFADAQQSAFEGAPAACALGHRGGPLRVYFLAGRQPPMVIENPRQVSAYRYPSDYGPRSPTFSRAAVVALGGGSTVLFISGTASIVGHLSMHPGDVRRQTEETLTNIGTLCDEAVLNRRGAGLVAGTASIIGHLSTHLGDVRRQTEETLTNIAVLCEEAASRSGLDFALCDLICTVYLRRGADLPAVREVFEARVGVGSVAARQAIYVEADICRADLLVEIEAQTFTLTKATP